jgi:CubicO group peptidase (beta-lactamase class C family)
VVTSERIVASGVDGVRRQGLPEKATLDDRWHLGSCTKAMTATLVALLVESARMRWETTVGEAFPDLAPRMDAAWRPVPVEWLLQNRAGAPRNLDADGLWGRLWGHGGPGPEQRLALVEGVTARPPVNTPGTANLYSNAGFAIAGAMAETLEKTAWEDLMRERLFAPLGISSAGFGAPGTPDVFDQARGHGGDGAPVEPGPGSDNPAAIGPAGTVHMTLPDWAKFVQLHLQGPRGASKLLPKAAFTRLHTPPKGQEYAMGWGVAHRDWAGGRTLTHAGSNTMWYCVVWLSPARDFATLVATNRGGDEAAKGCDVATGALIQDHLARGRER